MQTLQVDVQIFGRLQVDVTLPVNFISETAEVDINYSTGVLSSLGSIEAPGSVNVPKHEMRDTAGALLGSGEFDEDLVAPDGQIEDSQGANIGSVKSGNIYTFSQIPVKQQDDTIIGNGEVTQNLEIKGMNFNILSAIQVGNVIQITFEGDGIQYNQIKREVDTSYDLYDNGWWFINRPAELRNPVLPAPAVIQKLDPLAADPFTTLKYDNIHGNKNRFTAQDGSQTVPAGGVIQDHYEYMEWINTFFANATRDTHLANAEADTTDGGATLHWRLAGRRDLFSIIDDSNSGAFASIFPFTNTNIWTSDRYAASSGNSLYAWGGQLFSRRVAGAYAYRGCYCRKGTW